MPATDVQLFEDYCPCEDHAVTRGELELFLFFKCFQVDDLQCQLEGIAKRMHKSLVSAIRSSVVSVDDFANLPILPPRPNIYFSPLPSKAMLIAWLHQVETLRMKLIQELERMDRLLRKMSQGVKQSDAKGSPAPSHRSQPIEHVGLVAASRGTLATMRLTVCAVRGAMLTRSSVLYA
ncbi:hypothetical protein IAU60_006057 [Kwoniella sp. DSM 27419]